MSNRWIRVFDSFPDEVIKSFRDHFWYIQDGMFKFMVSNKELDTSELFIKQDKIDAVKNWKMINDFLIENGASINETVIIDFSPHRYR